MAGQVLKGMARSYVKRYGQDALPPSRREQSPRHEVIELISMPDNIRLGNLRLSWSSSPGGIALKALLQTEAQPGFSKDEVPSNKHGYFDLS